jgi:hypothetical protein
MEGGDRVDADGIPLQTISHRQNALFLNFRRGLAPRFTLPWIDKMFHQGVPFQMVSWEQVQETPPSVG